MVKHCLAFLTFADTEYVPFWTLQAECPNGDALRDRLAPFDVVLTQVFEAGAFGPMTSADVKATARLCVMYPNIFLHAFHPDQIYVETIDESGARVNANSPIGHYNSAIALFGFLSGFTVPETLSLYRTDVYEALGYLDVWDSVHLSFIEQCRQLSFPGEEAFVKWARSGNFLHSPNHPKIAVMEDVSRIAMKVAGIACHPASCGDYIVDGLMDMVWPVYPEIGTLFGITGSYVFRRAGYVAPPDDGYPTFVTLGEMVEGSFKTYARHGAANLFAPRVSAFFENSEILARVTPVGRSVAD